MIKVSTNFNDNKFKTAQNSVKNGTSCEFLEIKHSYFSSSSFTFILATRKVLGIFTQDIKSAVLGRSRPLKIAKKVFLALKNVKTPAPLYNGIIFLDFDLALVFQVRVSDLDPTF